MNYGTFLQYLIYIITIVPIGYIIFLVIMKAINHFKIPKMKEIIYEKLFLYKLVSLSMEEDKMLDIMNYYYDKSICPEYTSYRFTYITKGASGNIKGSFGGIRFYPEEGTGDLQGKLEQHDESTVTIKCDKFGKVIEITPYNMSNIILPDDYMYLKTLMKNLNISLKKKI